MGQITLRPELVTSSGEACGIMLDNQYVGSLTLLFREEDRLWGSVQLDEEVLHADEKEEIDLYVHRYIENMVDAVAAEECFVATTYSPYDHIISTDYAGHVEEDIRQGDGIDADEYTEYDTLEDGYEVMEEQLSDDFDTVEYDFDYDLAESHRDIELNIVGESRNKVEYQLLDENHEIMAEVMVLIDRGDVIGDVFWHYTPSEEELDEVAHILIADFDPDLIDTFIFTMYDRDELIAMFELTHDDLLEEEHELLLEGDPFLDEDHNIYVDVHGDESVNLHFELIRDDADSLTFDIYEDEHHRNSRIGTATIDIDEVEPSAIVDFVNPRDTHLREQIAYHLIDEVDKETDYRSFTITMQYQDEIIDEFQFHIDEQPELCH